MGLSDRVCLVTGSAGGIGRVYAERFAAEGAIVVIADLDEERAGATAAEIGDTAYAVALDVGSMEISRAAVEKVHGRSGRIDILINNAAIYADIDMEDASEEYLERILSVNMLGAWRMSKAVLPYMIEAGWGRIIHQSSVAAYTYQFARPPAELPSFSYAWSKWGINGLTKFMAGALGRHGITVNCIAPGPTMTDATRKAVSEKMLVRLEAMTSIGRVLQPEDLVDAALFFASDGAAAVTGQILCVDGGMFMPA